ncbi:MAG TPA: hypothetical protein VFD36_20660 [Kofleriaceae bacterium]|nr:hypothetical protein [Kofleriaceae bacterium]
MTDEVKPELTKEQLREFATNIVANLIAQDRDGFEDAIEDYLRAVMMFEPEPFACATNFFSGIIRSLTGNWGTTPEELEIAGREAPLVAAAAEARLKAPPKPEPS